MVNVLAEHGIHLIHPSNIDHPHPNDLLDQSAYPLFAPSEHHASPSPSPFQNQRVALVGSFRPRALETVKATVIEVGGELVKLSEEPTRVVQGTSLSPNLLQKVLNFLALGAGRKVYTLNEFRAAAEKELNEKREKDMVRLDKGKGRADRQSSVSELPQDTDEGRRPSISPASMDKYLPPAHFSPHIQQTEDVRNPQSSPIFCDKNGQPWEFYIDSGVSQSIQDHLANRITINGGRLVHPTQADIVLYDPHHPIYPSGPSEQSVNPEANLRPWHWATFCDQEQKLVKMGRLRSKVPVFIRKREGGGAAMLQCWFAEGLTDRRRLEGLVLAYGGLVTKRRQNADVFIVDPEATDGVTQTVIATYSNPPSKSVMSYEWVTMSIEHGDMASLPVTEPDHTPLPDKRSTKTPFTPEEDRHLVHFIAREFYEQDRVPRKGQKLGITGNKLYQLLVSDAYKPEEPREWSTTHPWESWRTRYKNQASQGMDRALSRALEHLKRTEGRECSPPDRGHPDFANEHLREGEDEIGLRVEYPPLEMGEDEEEMEKRNKPLTGCTSFTKPRRKGVDLSAPKRSTRSRKARAETAHPSLADLASSSMDGQSSLPSSLPVASLADLLPHPGPSSLEAEAAPTMDEEDHHSNEHAEVAATIALFVQRLDHNDLSAHSTSFADHPTDNHHHHHHHHHLHHHSTSPMPLPDAPHADEPTFENAPHPGQTESQTRVLDDEIDDEDDVEESLVGGHRAQMLMSDYMGMGGGYLEDDSQGMLGDRSEMMLKRKREGEGEGGEDWAGEGYSSEGVEDDGPLTQRLKMLVEGHMHSRDGELDDGLAGQSQEELMGQPESSFQHWEGESLPRPLIDPSILS